MPGSFASWCKNASHFGGIYSVEKSVFEGAKVFRTKTASWSALEFQLRCDFESETSVKRERERERERERDSKQRQTLCSQTNNTKKE